MKKAQGWYLAPVAVACAILCLASAGLAQTVELQLNNPPSPNIMDDIYVGSYSAQNLTSGGSVQVICDDFEDNSDFNKANYNTNSFSSLGNTLWGNYLMSAAGGSFSLGQVTTLYEEAAWLAMGVLGQSGTQQGYYSYAVWAIFDPSGVASWLTKYNDSAACNAVFGANSWGSGGCTAGSGGLVGSAKAASSGFTAAEFANVMILTPLNSNGKACTTPGTCSEQEFFQVVAEGGTAALYLLIAGVACFAAMFFRSRLQPSGMTSA